MVANSGYKPGYVNFSCRVARIARNRDSPVNIIESLKAVAALDEGNLVERMGEVSVSQLLGLFSHLSVFHCC